MQDADQLLEKRVRSRFSHRKLLFLPPQKEDLQRLSKHILSLPTDSSLPPDYVPEFNSRISLISFAEYKTIHDSFHTSDNYSRSVCLRAFEHLLERQLKEFADRGHNQSIEFRSVKLLIAPSELHQGLKSNRSCPAILQKLMES
ncbi:origin of replication complex subunit 4 [Tanacetum coccineum]